MPATEVELDDRNKSLHRIVHIGHREKGVWVCHEAEVVRDLVHSQSLLTYFVILSSIDLSSRMKVGRVILERSAPGRSCEMIWESTKRSVVVRLSRLVIAHHCSAQSRQLSHLRRFRGVHQWRICCLLLVIMRCPLGLPMACSLFRESPLGRRALPSECRILGSGYLIKRSRENGCVLGGTRLNQRYDVRKSLRDWIR